MSKIQDHTEALEVEIAVLSVGYIPKKTINGKTQEYHQWTEDGNPKRNKDSDFAKYG